MYSRLYNSSLLLLLIAKQLQTNQTGIQEKVLKKGKRTMTVLTLYSVMATFFEGLKGYNASSTST